MALTGPAAASRSSPSAIVNLSPLAKTGKPNDNPSLLRVAIGEAPIFHFTLNQDTPMRTACELLSDIIRSNRAVFLCGAGVSAASGIPLVNDLLNELGTKAGLEASEVQAMKTVQFEYLFTRLQEAVPIETLVQIFQLERPNLAHYVIALLHKAALLTHLITTNFDCNFESAVCEC